MKILGIDLAANQNKKSGICILDERLKAFTFSLLKDEEILNLAKKISPKIIAIDAPLSFPKKQKKAFRKCDRDILKLGIRIFPLKFKSMRDLAKRGAKLKKVLQKKFKVIEVFPRATKEILDLSLEKNPKSLKRELQKLKIKILKKNPTIHELDAICAAFTGYLFLKKMATKVGEKREGEIVIPRREKKILNCKIDISKKVFLPRVETEFWVKKCIQLCKKEIKKRGLKKVKFLDIFAGTGWIGILILKNFTNSFVDFVDVDKEAIEQIKINLKLNRISPKKYRIFESDLFKRLKGKKYDFIFANPPYVAKERIFEIQERVKKKEPKIAWFGGKEGLGVIKKFLREAKHHLKEGGKIFMEIDPFQKEKIKEILEKEGYKDYKFYKDQFRKIRWLKIS